MLQVFSQGKVLQRYVQKSSCHDCIGQSVLIGNWVLCNENLAHILCIKVKRTMLFWKGHAFLDPLFPCNIWLLGCSLSQRIWVHRYDTLDTRCMWRVHAYFLEYLWHKSQKYHNSIILNHMNTCTLARFQCIYGWFAFSIAKASKASKILCRAFGPKCDYDGDIVICYFVFARMCVVQALLALGFISSLRQRGTSQLFGGCVCNMHSILCSMLLVFLFLVSMFLVFPEKFLF